MKATASQLRAYCSVAARRRRETPSPFYARNAWASRGLNRRRLRLDTASAIRSPVELRASEQSESMSGLGVEPAPHLFTKGV